MLPSLVLLSLVFFLLRAIADFARICEPPAIAFLRILVASITVFVYVLLAPRGTAVVPSTAAPLASAALCCSLFLRAIADFARIREPPAIVFLRALAV